MEPKKIRQQFAIAILLSGKQKGEIAKLMNISASHLSNLLGGRDRMTEDKRAKLNKVLKTSI